MTIFKDKVDKPETPEAEVTVSFEGGKCYVSTPEDNPINYPQLRQAIAALQSFQRHMEQAMEEIRSQN